MSLEVGTSVGELSVRITRAQLVRYAGASTDFNPIHWSDRAAGALGLEGVIAHGMLTMGSALRVVTDWAGDPAAVRTYSARFTRPVVVPDDDTGVELRCVGTVTAVSDDSVTVSVEVTCGGEKVLGAVTAEVSTPAAAR
ncbi:MAG TPA: MaoC/PaaZ C-terminal domain-containing protein [Propionibacteriaceae bacterium]|nr:MaoC/PaaZ C-terminal domain-containing protein [Propionibacteriaceae bacterium]